MTSKILILDFGSQYTQLIARRVREIGVYCEIHPFDKIPVLDDSVKGVILSGSPASVRNADAPRIIRVVPANSAVVKSASAYNTPIPAFNGCQPSFSLSAR